MFSCRLEQLTLELLLYIDILGASYLELTSYMLINS